MYPRIFGVIDSYVVMLILGVVACFLLYWFYAKKKNDSVKLRLDFLLVAIISIISGIIFACLFENLYELIQDPSTYKWTWGMTFYGGLFGGVLAFFLMYFLYFKKIYGSYLQRVFIIAPACITLAHTFGRIGCFLEGCCYGKPTDAWFGIKFVTTSTKVIPTQLFEAIFLAILTIIFIFLSFKDFKYSLVIYCVSYSIFRFIIEFYRGDPRGGFFLSLSPSQWWCFVLFIISIPLFLVLRNIIYKKKEVI